MFLSFKSPGADNVSKVRPAVQKTRRLFMGKERPSRFSGTLCGAGVIVIWALTASIIEFAGEVNPFLFLAIQYIAGLFVFSARWGLRRENPLKSLRKVPLWFYPMVFMGLGVHNLTWIFAIQNAPSQQATLLIYQWPILLVIFTAIALKQKLRASHFAACALGFFGIFVLLTGKGLSMKGFVWMGGHSHAVVCALSWSIYSAIAARHRYISDNVLAINFLVVAVISILAWVFGYDAVMPSGRSLFIVVAASTFMASTYVLWDYAIKNGEPLLLAFFSFFTPALATCFLVLFGFAVFTPSLAVSLTLIMSAVVLSHHKSISALLSRIRAEKEVPE